MDKVKETAFLHALATPLSIAIISIKQEMKEMSLNGADESKLRRLKRALEAMQQIEKLHADHKNTVFKAA